jgi:uncharacterized protein (DUF1330 family)
MAKAYWICFYHSITDPQAFGEYVKLAPSAVQSGGGRFLVRGEPAQAYEAGKKARVVVIEFDSVEQAITTHDGEAYQAALRALGSGAVRDIRIVEGLPG